MAFNEIVPRGPEALTQVDFVRVQDGVHVDALQIRARLKESSNRSQVESGGSGRMGHTARGPADTHYGGEGKARECWPVSRAICSAVFGSVPLRVASEGN
jgi:hypothetical protein